MNSKHTSFLWNAIARDLLKEEMSRKGVTTEELRSRLQKIGVNESKAAIANKLSRGSFSARFFLQAFHAIGGEKIELPADVLQRISDVNREEVREPAAYYGTRDISWEGLEEFLYNSFENEWYVATDGLAEKPRCTGGKVVSLFTGAGGLDIGLENAGFETVACVEVNEDCKETLRRNRQEWTIVEGERSGDVRYVEVDEILQKANLKKGEAALVVGGAPCQPFSNIGKKGGVTDEKNGGDLFQEFVRIVTGLMPKAFIFENVVGITQQKHKEVLAYMQSCFSGLGYGLTYRIMNAADYGVPQKRNRFILVGLKNGPAPALPAPTHFKSVDLYREFCFQTGRRRQKMVPLWRTVGDAFQSISESDLARPDNVVMNISEPVRARMRLIGPGENFHVLPMDMRPNCWKTGKHQGQDTFGRLRLDQPSVTIRTAAYNPAKGRYIHPTENRGLNSLELAALQGFPADWRFYCAKYEKVTLTSVGRQIGNAVPVQLAEALGVAIQTQLARLEDFSLQKCV
ncbi:MAG: DNA cytosine methyltransferase [Verrucomicrobia bacterium]|nr:DNA cytosine methyltransferase [Verrucomicrobiota bacterium]